LNKTLNVLTYANILFGIKTHQELEQMCRWKKQKKNKNMGSINRYPIEDMTSTLIRKSRA